MTASVSAVPCVNCAIWKPKLNGFYQATALTDAVIGLRNAVRTAVIVAMAAWTNKTSMGCHYRE
jgi:L-aspartate oxidase